MTPPCLVNLTALPSRLISTWRSRCGSPSSGGSGIRGRSARSARPWRSPPARRSPAPAPARRPCANGTLSTRSLPASIFEKSRMSSMTCIRCSADSWTTVAHSRCSALSGVSNSSAVMPSTPFIGVRISWLMRARNSLLARAAGFGRVARLAQLGLVADARGDVGEEAGGAAVEREDPQLDDARRRRPRRARSRCVEVGASASGRRRGRRQRGAEGRQRRVEPLAQRSPPATRRSPARPRRSTTRPGRRAGSRTCLR